MCFVLFCFVSFFLWEKLFTCFLFHEFFFLGNVSRFVLLGREREREREGEKEEEGKESERERKKEKGKKIRVGPI